VAGQDQAIGLGRVVEPVHQVHSPLRLPVQRGEGRSVPDRFGAAVDRDADRSLADAYREGSQGLRRAVELLVELGPLPRAAVLERPGHGGYDRLLRSHRR